MKTLLISRHPGAVDWLRRRFNVTHARVVAHLDVATLEPEDRVIGTLPVQAIAEVWARGAVYYHLSIPMPANRRGQELTADDLDVFGAKLACFYAEPRPQNDPLLR
jgi:CRISPR-associated protein Csx16